MFIEKLRLGKKLRKLMKNRPKHGRSVRNGNMPSPYTKYGKTPYKYAFVRKVVEMQAESKKDSTKIRSKNKYAA